MAVPVLVTNFTIPTPLPAPVLINPIGVSTTSISTASPVLNPLFDIAPFHGIQLFWLNTIPLWALIGFVVVAYWMWYNISWWRKCGVLRPCYGYKDALMAGSLEAQQTIVFTKSRKWFIRLLTYHSEGMLYFKDLLKSDIWHMGASSAVGTLGGLSAAITKDNFDEVVDPVADIALCTGCFDFNHGGFGDPKNKERASQEIQTFSFSRPDGTECNVGDAIVEGLIPDTVSSFDDYVRLRSIMEAIWPDGIRIPCYTLYDPYDSDKFTPKQRSASLNGGIIIQDARDYAVDNLREPGWWDKNGVAMILILGGLIVLGASFLATKG